MRAWLEAMAKLVGFTLIMCLNAGMWWYWVPFMVNCGRLHC